MKKYFLVLLPAMFMLFAGCKKEDTPAPLKIGDLHQGGYVFYLDATGQHGMVMGPVETETSLPIGCSGTLMNIYGVANSPADNVIGWGAYCTSRMVLMCNQPNTAARYCYDLEYGGFNDWVLPNTREWWTAGKELGTSTGAALKVNSRYWVAFEADANRGGYFVPSQPNQTTFDAKTAFYLVRPVRSF